jgi:mono/diheme cytochrome c family protein
VNEGDGGADVEASAPVVVALAIVSADGRPLQGAPGDALPLAVALTMSDGVTVTASDDQVIWLTPITLAAKDPYDAGADIVPEAGVQPTAFFVRNDYRQTNPGVLYVVDQGEVANPTIVVTASVPDAGEVSAVVSILPALVGDAASGEALFLHGPECGICHGSTGGGSLPALLPDGGPELIDGGPAYAISGQLYSYPAPGLNNAPDSGNLASDPAWNAALLGMAAQSDMDNRGVALRTPMPDWFGGTNASGGTLSGQDFADIYAWLKTQTQ